MRMKRAVYLVKKLYCFKLFIRLFQAGLAIIKFIGKLHSWTLDRIGKGEGQLVFFELLLYWLTQYQIFFFNPFQWSQLDYKPVRKLKFGFCDNVMNNSRYLYCSLFFISTYISTSTPHFLAKPKKKLIAQL